MKKAFVLTKEMIPKHTMGEVTVFALSILRTADILSRYFELQLRKKRSRVIETPMQFAVVNLILLREGRKTPTNISKWVFRSRHTVTSMLDTLTKKKLLKREPDEKDRRSIRIVPTQKGIDTNYEIIPFFEEMSRNALAGIDTKKLEEVSNTLKEIRRHLLQEL